MNEFVCDQLDCVGSALAYKCSSTIFSSFFEWEVVVFNTICVMGDSLLGMGFYHFFRKQYNGRSHFRAWEVVLNDVPTHFRAKWDLYFQLPARSPLNFRCFGDRLRINFRTHSSLELWRDARRWKIGILYVHRECRWKTQNIMNRDHYAAAKTSHRPTTDHACVQACCSRRSPHHTPSPSAASAVAAAAAHGKHRTERTRALAQPIEMKNWYKPQTVCHGIHSTLSGSVINRVAPFSRTIVVVSLVHAKPQTVNNERKTERKKKTSLSPVQRTVCYQPSWSIIIIIITTNTRNQLTGEHCGPSTNNRN